MSFGCYRFVAVLALSLLCNGIAEAPLREHWVVDIGAHDGDWARSWISAHAQHGIQFRPFLVEPDPTHAAKLAELASRHQGHYFEGAAWIREGERLRFRTPGGGSQMVAAEGQVKIRKHQPPQLVDGLEETVGLREVRNHGAGKGVT